MTKDAIKASFARLLEEKPYNKITVNDIASLAGVNRNSFYYHFQDIPSLLEELIVDDTDRIIEGFPSISSAEECLRAVLSNAQEHRRSVMHIYNSVNRDVYDRHLWRLCQYCVSKLLEKATEGRRLNERDKEIMTDYYVCLLFGAVSYWLETGMDKDMNSALERLIELREGQTEMFIRNCEEN